MTVNYQNLIEKYAPEVRLHKDEKNFPSSVDWYLERASLYNRDGGNRIEGPPLSYADLLAHNNNDNSEADPSIFLSIREDAQGGQDPESESVTCYANVVHLENGIIDIVYWFFYPYQSGMAFDITGKWFGHHVGDWEHFSIRLQLDQTDEEIVLGGYYSAHGNESHWHGDPMKHTSEGHPIVYSALASHANYNTAGEKERGWWPPLPNDYTSDGGKAWKTWKDVKQVEWKKETPTLNGQDWIKYNGAWGQSQEQLGGIFVASSPAGPATKETFQEGAPEGPSGIWMNVPHSSGKVVGEVNGGYLFAASNGYVHVFNPKVRKKGKVSPLHTWGFEHKGEHTSITTKADPQTDIVTIYAGSNGYAACLRFTPTPDGGTLEEVWETSFTQKQSHTTVLLHKDKETTYLLFGVHGRVYHLSEQGEKITKQLMHDQNVGSERVSLSAIGTNLYVGTNGHVLRLALDNNLHVDKHIDLSCEANTNVLAVEDNGKIGVYAGLHGRIYQLNPDTLKEQHKNMLSQSPSVGAKEVRLTFDSQHVYAGSNGYVIALDRDNVEKQTWYQQLDGRKGLTAVLAVDGSLFVGCMGRGYQFTNPSKSKEHTTNPMTGTEHKDVEVAFGNFFYALTTKGIIAISLS